MYGNDAQVVSGDKGIVFGDTQPYQVPAAETERPERIPLDQVPPCPLLRFSTLPPLSIKL